MSGTKQGGNKKENTTSRQNARHLSVTSEKTPRLASLCLPLNENADTSPEVRCRSNTTRVQTRRRHACHGPQIFVNPTAATTPRQVRVAGIPVATLRAYQHTHMCGQLLQGILLKRSCPHGMDAMMQLLIGFSISGHSHPLPWSDSRVL
jgi:hypothetical protein